MTVGDTRARETRAQRNREAEKANMAITTVHLMRHGEVDNPQGVLYERLPGYGLTPRGQQMTAITAQWLQNQGRDISQIFASPLQRAQESAAPAAKLFDLPIQPEARLIEAGSKFAGHQIHRSKLTLAHPRYWPWYVAPWRPSWGEAYSDIARRMFAAVSHIRACTEPGREALAVSHQSPIWILRRFIEGKPLAHNPKGRECALASLTSLHFDGATLIGWEYVSPAADLVTQASDMTPGTSKAATNRG